MTQAWYRTKFLWNVLIATWALAALCGWLWVTKYTCTGTAIADSEISLVWPDNTLLQRGNDVPTILLFVHPRCPCTVASVRELERVLTAAPCEPSRRPKLLIVASLPQKADSPWRESPLIRQVQQVSSAEIVWDFEGIETQRFGACTSGDVKYYDRQGNLLFSGGITTSRGHEGASKGGDQLIELLRHNGKTLQDFTPVFGCQLYRADPNLPSSENMVIDVAMSPEKGNQP